MTHRHHQRRWIAFTGGEAGFTLIEMIITIILVAIISGSAGLITVGGMNAYVAGDIRSDLTNQGRLAIERMAREIRMVRSRTNADVPTMLAATLSFIDVGGNVITYTSGGGTVTRNGIPLAGATTAALNFSYFQPGALGAAGTGAQLWTVQVDLTMARGGESQAFRVLVHPRSF